MKKAQSMIEVSLILVLVVVVSLALWPMFNNQKTKLAELSKSNISTQSISGRQVQLKNDALNLASNMGLTVNNPNDTKAVLDGIKKKIDDLSANPNPDASQLALIETYTNQYKELSNELASINATGVTINDNTIVTGAQGGKVSSTPVIQGDVPSSVTKTSITGHYAAQTNPRGDDVPATPSKPAPAVTTTGITADSGIEESTHALTDGSGKK